MRSEVFAVIGLDSTVEALSRDEQPKVNQPAYLSTRGATALAAYQVHSLRAATRRGAIPGDLNALTDDELDRLRALTIRAGGA